MGVQHYRKSALMVAAAKGFPLVMRELLKAGADINLRDEFGTSALMLSAQYANFDEVVICIENGADINCQDKLGRTALHLANINPDGA